jgi:hypothetical protein
MNLKNAFEPTQTRNGAKTQRLRLPDPFTRWVSEFTPLLFTFRASRFTYHASRITSSPRPWRLCLLASLR